jgi:UMF1 family MFS transporter
VSTPPYAIGYLGGGVLLVVNLAWILSPTTFGLSDSVAAIRLSFVSVAVWWLVILAAVVHSGGRTETVSRRR